MREWGYRNGKILSTAVKIFIDVEMAVDDIFDSESDGEFNVLVRLSHSVLFVFVREFVICFDYRSCVFLCLNECACKNMIPLFHLRAMISLKTRLLEFRNLATRDFIRCNRAPQYRSGHERERSRRLEAPGTSLGPPRPPSIPDPSLRQTSCKGNRREYEK